MRLCVGVCACANGVTPPRAVLYGRTGIRNGAYAKVFFGVGTCVEVVRSCVGNLYAWTCECACRRMCLRPSRGCTCACVHTYVHVGVHVCVCVCVCTYILF